MNILFVCENYLPHYGGAEVLFKNLAERYVKLGHGVMVLTHRLKGTPKTEVINGVTVKRINTFFSRYLFTFFAIPTAISLARKYDIIQTTTFNGAPPAWIAARLTRKPVVLTVHEVWQGKWRGITGFSWLKSWLHELLEKSIYFLPYNHYACVSNATQRDLLTLKIPPEKVTTIYDGFDYSLWNPSQFTEKDAAEFRAKNNLQGKFVFFSWGRPGPSKGFEYAIKAMPLIVKEVPNTILVLMFGSAEKYPLKYAKLMRLIQEINLPDYIKVIPSLPYEQLGIALKAADAAVIPSTSEGFGYTVLEAMAMKKPVVVSNAGSLPEVVGGKHQIFESKNVKDLAEKAVRIAKGEYLKKKERKFTWEECIQNYSGIYSKLLKKNKE